jgi:dUTPase
MLKLNSIGDLFEPLPYNVGDRVGQVYFIPVLPIIFEEVEELDETQRGEGGFGSTGISNLTTNIADGKININA